MDERSERIIQAAVELAERDGYDAVKLRELAERANVALATVYRRFSCKEDILAAALDQQDLRSELVVALAGLPPRQSDVLRWIFGLDGDEPLTLQEVGDRMEVTTERVRQLRDKAIRTMRTSMPLETLRVYLN